jgi:hypothetical protein
MGRNALTVLAKVHITTIVRLRHSTHIKRAGRSGTITAVVNALAKAGVELGENGSLIWRPKGKLR